MRGPGCARDPCGVDHPGLILAVAQIGHGHGTIAHRPDLVILDEPFSGLDNRLRDGIRDRTLELLKEEGAAVLLVTHEPDEAMRMADEIALMRAGRFDRQVVVDRPDKTGRAAILRVPMSSSPARRPRLRAQSMAARWRSWRRFWLSWGTWCE